MSASSIRQRSTHYSARATRLRLLPPREKVANGRMRVIAWAPLLFLNPRERFRASEPSPVRASLTGLLELPLPWRERRLAVGTRFYLRLLPRREKVANGRMRVNDKHLS